MTTQADRTDLGIVLIGQRADELERSPLMEVPGIVSSFGVEPSKDVLKAARMLVVAGSDADWVADQVHHVRSERGLSLRPLALLGDADVNGLASELDAVLPLTASRGDIESAIAQLGDIADRVDAQAEPMPTAVRYHGVDIDILRFLATRPFERMEPVADPDSTIGYSYPIVGDALGCAAGEELAVLEAWEDLRLLKGTLVDRVNLCPECGCYNINFREVCPSCGNLDVVDEVTLHHYRCGFVGREHDFLRDGELICPKCVRPMRHIGVDYDRPSQTIWCNDCGANSTDPGVSCLCLRCATTFPPQDATMRPIKAYALTELGQRAADDGVFPDAGLSDLLRGTFGFFRLETFRQFMTVESHRCGRNGTHSSLIRLRIANFSEISAVWGPARTQQALEEFSTILKDTVRHSDVLSYVSSNDLLVLMTDTSTEDAGEAFARIREQCDTLFEKEMQLAVEVVAVGAETLDLEEVLRGGD